MKTDKRRIAEIISLASAGFLGVSVVHAQQLLNKPAWLPELSLGLSESYDDNILGVSGNGLQPKGSWITSLTLGIGVDFAPLLGHQSPFEKLELSYRPDFVVFHNAPAENHDAHKFGTAIKESSGDFSFSLDNAFLYNDGNKTAPAYALNQLSGPLGNQFDKYRNQFANTPARERRSQVDDQGTTALQYDIDRAFVRATSALLYYNMDTALHNTSKAPYLGYQNYPDRSDVNGGLDFGYNVMTNLALTLGYRYGSQYQQQFTPNISSDFHFSSSKYQRVLFGAEGNPFGWLNLKLSAGPDFRHYNSDAPVPDFHPTKYYAEAAVTAKITTNQSVAVNYKQWTWVASSGYVPEFDSSYRLTYHWQATKQWGLQLAGEILEADYTIGNDTAGNAPSLRNERLYEITPSVSYAFTRQLSATLSYTYDAGNNELPTIPASSHASYKNFMRDTVALDLVYNF